MSFLDWQRMMKLVIDLAVKRMGQKAGSSKEIIR